MAWGNDSTRLSVVCQLTILGLRGFVGIFPPSFRAGRLPLRVKPDQSLRGKVSAGPYPARNPRTTDRASSTCRPILVMDENACRTTPPVSIT